MKSKKSKEFLIYSDQHAIRVLQQPLCKLTWMDPRILHTGVFCTTKAEVLKIVLHKLCLEIRVFGTGDHMLVK